MEARRIADDVLEIRVSSVQSANALAAQLREDSGFAAAEEIVAGFETVSLKAPPQNVNQLIAQIRSLATPEFRDEAASETVDIPIRYGGDDGPDLKQICDHLNQSEADFIALHSSLEHNVDLIGFIPGFTYISGLPGMVQVPRLGSPRPRVAAGSVGVSGNNTGIYAMPGPGGWPLIGRTEMTLFDPAADPPFKLRPGLKVRFVPV